MSMKKEQTVGYHSSLKVWGLFLSFLPVMCLAEVDTRLSDSLRKSLEAQGWQEYQAEDGSVVYRKQDAQTKLVDHSTVVERQEKKRLGEALDGRGWQSEWSSDGSLILRPQAQPVSSTTMSQPIEAENQTGMVPDLPGFEYWRIEKSDDGSVLFHPLPKLPAVQTTASNLAQLSRCEGYQLPMQGVILPVDQWAEANELAQNWLTASGLQGLLVGRIRKVLRVYLVSLVEATAPYGLQHQLAIRAVDGRAMLLE